LLTRRPRGRLRPPRTACDHAARSRWLAFVAFAGLALVGFACAHDSGFTKGKTFDPADAEKPRHFLVLPVNLTIKTPPEFEPVLDDMFGAIAGYIRDHGDTLETFSRKDATAQWAESILEVKRSKELPDRFETAMRVYVERLAQTQSFDAVIVPSLVYRTTKTRDRVVKWDGVFRKAKVINLSDEAKKKGLARQLTLSIDGISLHVMVFDREGDLIFRQYGGLDLAHDVDMTNAEFTMSPRPLLKERLLKDTDHLNEGIAVAFDPYLPKP